MIKSYFILFVLLMVTSCAGQRYVNKDLCTEIGGPILECAPKAIIK